MESYTAEQEVFIGSMKIEQHHSGDRVRRNRHVLGVLAIASLCIPPLIQLIHHFSMAGVRFVAPGVSFSMADEGVANAINNQLILIDTVWIAWTGLSLREKTLHGAFLACMVTAGGCLRIGLSFFLFGQLTELSHLRELSPMVAANGFYYLSNFVTLTFLFHLTKVFTGLTFINPENQGNHRRPAFSLSTMFVATGVIAFAIALLQAAHRQYVEFANLNADPESIFVHLLMMFGSAFAHVLLVACAAMVLTDQRHTLLPIALILATAIALTNQALLFLQYQEELFASTSFEDFLWSQGILYIMASSTTLILSILTFKLFTKAGFRLRRLPRSVAEATQPDATA